uniref:DZF domain-containing protein n=1 Tax=Macrostomum lignano TaxID=282301 RepID=A0A1I8F7E8_9PLAT
ACGRRPYRIVEAAVSADGLVRAAGVLQVVSEIRPVVTRVHHGVFPVFAQAAAGERHLQLLAGEGAIGAVQLLLLAMSPMLHIVDEEGRQSVGTVGPLHPQVVRHGNKEAVLHTEHALLRAVVHMALEHRGHDCGRDLQDQHQADQTGVLRNLGWWGRAAVGGTARLFNTGQDKRSRYKCRACEQALVAIRTGLTELPVALVMQHNAHIRHRKARIERLQECRQGHPALTIISRHLDSFIAPQQPQKPTSRPAAVTAPPLIGYRAYVTLIGSLGDLLMNLNRSFLLTATQMPRPKLAMPNMKKATLKMKRIILAREVLQPMLTVVLAIRLAKRHRRLAVSMGNQIAADHEVWPASRWGERTNPSRADWITEHAVATDSPLSKSNGCWLRFQQLGCTSEGLITKRAIFNYLNNGNPLDKDTNDSEQGYDRLGRHPDGAAGRQRAPKAWRQRRRVVHQPGQLRCSTAWTASPRGRLEALLAFNVIPRHVSDQARQRARAGEADGGRRQPAQCGRSAGGSAGGGGAAGEPADYRLLGNKLGFYESDMNQIENLYAATASSSCTTCLTRMAQAGERQGAYVITLQKVLQETGRRRPLLSAATDVGGDEERLRQAASALQQRRRIHQSGRGGGDSGSDESSSWSGRLGADVGAPGSQQPGALRLLLARPGVLEPHLGDALVQLGPLRDLLQVGAVGVVVEVEVRLQDVQLLRRETGADPLRLLCRPEPS